GGVVEAGGSGGTAAGGSGSGGSASGGSGSGGSTEEPDAGDGGTSGGTGGVTGAGGAFPPGPHKVVLLVGDIHTTDQSRLQLIELLNSMKESHGVTVEVMDSRVAKYSAFMDASLVIAGPNNNYCSDTPDPSIKTMPIPVIVSRDCKTTAIGLGTMMNTQEYVADVPVKLEILKSDHPLTAGLSGIVPV